VVLHNLRCTGYHSGLSAWPPLASGLSTSVLPEGGPEKSLKKTKIQPRIGGVPPLARDFSQNKGCRIDSRLDLNLSLHQACDGRSSINAHRTLSWPVWLG